MVAEHHLGVKVQQRLERLFGEAVELDPHFGLDHGREPAAIELLEGHAGEGFAQACAVPGHGHLAEQHLTLAVEFGDQWRQLGGQIFEARRLQEVLADASQRVAAGGGHVSKAGERDVALVPETVADQAQQEQQLFAPYREVQREEPLGAVRRAGLETLQALAEHLLALVLRPAEQPPEPVVVVENPHVQIAQAETAVLAHEGATLFGEPARVDEPLQPAQVLAAELMTFA